MTSANCAAIARLDQEIASALARATLSDRNATGTYGAGHDRGYYEGLLRSKVLHDLPGAARKRPFAAPGGTLPMRHTQPEDVA